MTTHLLCGKCGTRNQAALGFCRRCQTPLAGNASTLAATARGTPASELIAERWLGLGPLPKLGPSWSRARDVAAGSDVFIREISDEQGGLRGFAELAARRQGVVASGLLPLRAIINEGDRLLLVMPMVEGRPVKEVLEQREGMPISLALRFIEELIIGLDSLHEHGLCHGELTPEVVWMSQEGDIGQATALLMGGVMPFSEAGALDDYQALARVLATMLLGRRAAHYSGTAELLGAAIHRVTIRDGEDVASGLRGLADILVRSDGQVPRRRSEALDEVIHLMSFSDENPMVSVEGGPFQRGSDERDPDGRPEEKPAAMVDLGPFFIDKTPITVRQYRRYLDATGQYPSPAWESVNPDDGDGASKPVVFITWQEARDYARWAGKRLPTEAEWEKAARYIDGRLYPWGNTSPDRSKACYDGAPGPEPSGHRPAAQSEYGAHDMAGNVFEWVHDWFAADYYGRAPALNPVGPISGTKKVLRGGSFAHPAFALRCATRGRYDPQERRTNHSFRCAWSVHDPFDDEF